MTTYLTRLQATSELDRIAALLSRQRHLYARVAAHDPVPAGFVASVPAVDMWASTSSVGPPAVQRALRRWLERGAEFALFDIASFGLERLIEEVYFPLLVPICYCQVAVDFPMNLNILQRLATPDAILTVATMKDVVVAASLLQPSARTPFEHYSAMELVSHGLDVAASATRDPALADAFFYASLEMLEAQGVRAMRVRRSPWATQRNAEHWMTDLRRADRIAWEEREPHDYFWWQPAALKSGESVLSFQWVDGRLHPFCIGSPHAVLRSVERRLRELLGVDEPKRGAVLAG